MYAIWQALKPAEAAAARERQVSGLRHIGDNLVQENFLDGKVGRRATRSAPSPACSGRTVEKIVHVCKAAEADPERFGDLPQIMDEKSVNTAYHGDLADRRGVIQVKVGGSSSRRWCGPGISIRVTGIALQ